MIHNKKVDSIVTKLFIRGSKLNNSLVFITQSNFKVPKDVRLNTTHIFISKIPNKRELQQVEINYSSDISTKDFTNIYRKCTAEPYSFLFNETTLASDNPIKFRKLFLKYNKILTINDQIRDEILQYDINREAAKISVLSSSKVCKYEDLTGEDILPSNQQQIMKQARCTYSPSGKPFEKQIKPIEDQGEKQIKAIQDQGQLRTIKKYAYDAENTPFISKQKEIFDEIVDERHEKITGVDKKVNSDDLIYRYKGNTAGVKFDEFDNALNIINKIQNGEIRLADVKNNQEKFESYLGEIKKEKNQKSKKTICTILKRFTKQEAKLLNFMLIIL